MLNLRKFLVTAALVIAPATVISPHAYASTYEFESFKLEWDTIFAAGIQYRTQARKGSISRGSSGSTGDLDNLALIINNAFIINSNDGNNNFNQGITSERMSILSEADFNFGQWGVFVRGKMWHDFVYGQKTDMDLEAWHSNNANPVFSNNGGHNTTFGNFNPAAKDYSEAGSNLLDAFVYGTIVLPNDKEMVLRVGRQVISWGEALLSGGGVAMGVNSVDAHIRNQPGMEIKEIFLPTGAIFAQIPINDKIGLEAYYQYEWVPVWLDPSSSFMSEFDSIGLGGNVFIFTTGYEDRILGVDLNANEGLIRPQVVDGAFVDGTGFGSGPNGEWTWDNEQLHRLLKFFPTSCTPQDGRDATCRVLSPYKAFEDKPGNGGQYGLALNLLMDSGAEFSLFYVNYHEKIPNFILPIDAVEVFAPLIDTLIKIIDKEQYDATFGAQGRTFEGAKDLGSELSPVQINTLLGFLNSLPPHDTNIAGVIDYLVANPDRFFSETSILLPALFAVGNDPLLTLTAESLARLGADVFLQPFGMSSRTPVRNLHYRLEWADNVHMLGASYSTVLGKANVAAEVTYRDNTPVLGGDVPRTPQRVRLWNLHVNSLMVFEPQELFGIQLWDFSSMVVEGITWQIPGKLPFDSNDFANKDRLAVQNTPEGVGVSVFWSLEYQNVFTGWDVMVPIYMNWGIEGSQFNAGYRDGQVAAATGIAFKHLSGVEVGVGMMKFFGDTDDVFMMLTQDRDNVTVHFKYGF